MVQPLTAGLAWAVKLSQVDIVWTFGEPGGAWVPFWDFVRILCPKARDSILKLITASAGSPLMESPGNKSGHLV